MLDSPGSVALLEVPYQVVWSYSVGGAIVVIGVFAIFLRGEWQKAGGLDKLLLLGPLFYAAPIAAFGVEHFTLAQAIASIVPKWIPWHLFWAYLIGACFIAAALSLVTGIQMRLSASLLALTFFLFAVLMDLPGWSQNPRNRFALTFLLREISFSGGPLALAASLIGPERKRAVHTLATIARYFIAVPLLFYSFEQFMHPDHVPGVPLEPLTPSYVYGRLIWAYLLAVVYALSGALLLVGKKTRTAAISAGLAVLFVELLVYLPIGIVQRASLDNGLNYVFDTLMFCGTVLLLGTAMPRPKPPAWTAIKA